ncbi:protocadherin alpha-5-like [Carettochelys insculpta]|uniref:protocadherin alpha-5-like n=1 Tax=Carettochelys insculpta TaxID=44489 RepID=UPI003EBD0C9E
MCEDWSEFRGAERYRVLPGLRSSLIKGTDSQPGPAMGRPRRGGPGAGQLLRWAVLQAAWAAAMGQVRYSVAEEAEAGTVVGRLAQELGVAAAELVSRPLRVVPEGGGGSLEVNAQSGALLVRSRLDREALCGPSPRCALELEVVVGKPPRLFHVEVEIQDVNDNAPVFSVNEQALSIAESLALPGSRFPLEGASDADIGTNSQLSYALSPSEYFAVDVAANDDKSKSAELVLTKSLDREETPVHHLVLTATDGGKPPLTGTLQVVISVLDVNDNAPVFNQSVYKVQLLEGSANGALVIKLTATDLDEGVHKDIVYGFSSLVPPYVSEAFRIEENSGEIRVKGEIDFESITAYEIQVSAQDKGSPPLVGHCKVVVEVLDVNDNAPELRVTSLSVPVPEDAPPGTVVAVISVSDRDSGANGRVSCSIGAELPFRLVGTFKNSQALVLSEAVDRERVAEYEVVVRARDGGAPSLWASSRLVVPLSDVNDNAPAFAQAVYTVFVRENSPAGAPLVRVSAWDPDAGANGRVSYGAVERRVGERPLSSYVWVQAESGSICALQPLDYEEVQVLQFEVSARDGGLPSLSGQASVQVFVVDANDNAPVVSPWGRGLGPAWEVVSLSAGAGQVVGKVRAVDADSGYNAWLRYEVQDPLSAGPFRVGVYSGEISTSRALEEADGPVRSLVIVVRDHGEPALSASATVSLSLVESVRAVAWESGPGGGSGGAAVDSNVSLLIAIWSVSGLLVVVIAAWVGVRCCGGPAEACGSGEGPAVCSSGGGSWSSSQQQRQSRLVCVGEGGAKSDLMVFSPVVPSAAERSGTVKGQEVAGDSSEQVRPFPRGSDAERLEASSGALLSRQLRGVGGEALVPGSPQQRSGLVGLAREPGLRRCGSAEGRLRLCRRGASVRVGVSSGGPLCAWGLPGARPFSLQRGARGARTERTRRRRVPPWDWRILRSRSAPAGWLWAGRGRGEADGPLQPLAEGKQESEVRLLRMRLRQGSLFLLLRSLVVALLPCCGFVTFLLDL